MGNLVEIDGSYGSGGGQVLRTAIGLSALTATACQIKNIRAMRPQPGIREQHLQAINAVAKLCNARLQGAEIGSSQLEFIPGQITAKDVSVHISTAGSVGLVLQALSIAAVNSEVTIEITGGATYGKWAVPVSYLQNVLIPLLARYGYRMTINVEREGFYPKGGAKVVARISKADLQQIRLIDKGAIKGISGISTASEGLRPARVAERQADTAVKTLSGRFHHRPDIKLKYANTICPGSAVLLWVETEHSVIGASALGERGKRAEQVGSEAAEKLIQEFTNGTIDSYCADQILPYLALAKGEIQTSKITEHCQTNMFVIQQFLPVHFELHNTTIRVT